MSLKNTKKVAIVGRPNVGKSALFNRITNQRKSIVDDLAGVTRDRIYAETEWNREQFTLIDTGGLEFKSNAMMDEIREQVKTAVKMADVIIFVADITCGVTDEDLKLVREFNKSNKEIILCLNKADSQKIESVYFYDFYSLGLGEPIAVSSAHGTGIGDLLDLVAEKLAQVKLNDHTETDEEAIYVTIIGKPNSGKSSLVNKILNEKRVIVSEIAGTTRDSIDTEIKIGDKKYIFTDTAGMRKQNKIYENVEKHSILRTISAVERTNIAIILLDATEGITEQDTKIAGIARNLNRSSIIAINKWDLDNEKKAFSNYLEFENVIRKKLPFMRYAPIISISALTGSKIEKLITLINHVDEQSKMRVETNILNRVIQDLSLRMQPPSFKGKRLKIYYATQVGTYPPEFVLFVNDGKLMHFSYLRYIENQIRDVFKFEGAPIKFILKNRKDIE